MTTSSEIASSTASSTTSSSASPSSAPTTCAAPLPIVQNGDFETGNLDPWSVHSVSPASTPWYMYRVYETDPDNSTYAFRVQDSLASSYFNVQLGQLLTVCAGQKYNFSARYFMANARMVPMSIDVLLDRQILRGRQISTSPRYVDLSGSLTALEDTLAMTVSFSTAEKFLSATWGLDNVVITPA
ncbi:MAG: hypothetical protein L6R36_009401 [Xanthoria steineri]|nr:MAG: hypothetical protein L6R36_009401 [Xanthoria steineri]